MTVTGGYNIPVVGSPALEVMDLPVPERLCLPLASSRFEFGSLRVEDGQRVGAGDVLAVDPGRFSVPLLAPYPGSVRLKEIEGHVVLEDLETRDAGPDRVSSVSVGAESWGDLTARLLDLGAWQFVCDVSTGSPADPRQRPSAVIVSCARLEPFLAGGQAILGGHIRGFVRGLEHILALVPDAELYVVLPDVRDPFAVRLREAVSGCDGAREVLIPLRYPFESPALMARLLGIGSDAHSVVWALSPTGVLAVDASLTEGRPWRERVVSVAGPAASRPLHVRTVPGHPIEDIVRIAAPDTPSQQLRIVNGGLLSGEMLPSDRGGLAGDCEGLTLLPEETERTFLAFARPGLASRSYSRSFVGTLRPELGVSYTTSLSGEVRPCVSCGQCVDVCPARIMPNVVHKSLYAGDLERAIDTRVDLCVECGLCSYVCPSKIDLRQEFIHAKAEIQADIEAAMALEEEA